MRNQVKLRGTIAGQPAVQTSKSDEKIYMTFRLMVGTWKKDESGTSRKKGGMGFDVLVFRKDLISSIMDTAAYCDKLKVCVEGNIEFEDWSKGDRRGTSMTVIADDVTLLFSGQKVTVEAIPHLEATDDVFSDGV